MANHQNTFQHQLSKAQSNVSVSRVPEEYRTSDYTRLVSRKIILFSKLLIEANLFIHLPVSVLKGTTVYNFLALC